MAMNLSKFTQIWRQLMARPLSGVGIKTKLSLPKIELVPVKLKENQVKEKFEEIQRIISQIILFSHKRGRKRKDYHQEESYAA